MMSFGDAEDVTDKLYWAAGEGNVTAVDSLLGSGVNVNSESSAGMTPLHVAASKGHFRMVNHLLANGADPRVSNSYGLTPLHSACRGGDAQVVQKLLEAGADPKAKDTSGKTPSDFAIEAGHTAVAATLNARALAALVSPPKPAGGEDGAGVVTGDGNGGGAGSDGAGGGGASSADMRVLSDLLIGTLRTELGSVAHRMEKRMYALEETIERRMGAVERRIEGVEGKIGHMAKNTSSTHKYQKKMLPQLADFIARSVVIADKGREHAEGALHASLIARDRAEQATSMAMRAAAHAERTEHAAIGAMHAAQGAHTAAQGASAAARSAELVTRHSQDAVVAAAKNAHTAAKIAAAGSRSAIAARAHKSAVQEARAVQRAVEDSGLTGASPPSRDEHGRRERRKPRSSSGDASDALERVPLAASRSAASAGAHDTRRIRAGSEGADAGKAQGRRRSAGASDTGGDELEKQGSDMSLRLQALLGSETQVDSGGADASEPDALSLARSASDSGVGGGIYATAPAAYGSREPGAAGATSSDSAEGESDSADASPPTHTMPPTQGRSTPRHRDRSMAKSGHGSDVGAMIQSLVAATAETPAGERRADAKGNDGGSGGGSDSGRNGHAGAAPRTAPLPDLSRLKADPFAVAPSLPTDDSGVLSTAATVPDVVAVGASSSNGESPSGDGGADARSGAGSDGTASPVDAFSVRVADRMYPPSSGSTDPTAPTTAPTRAALPAHTQARLQRLLSASIGGSAAKKSGRRSGGSGGSKSGKSSKSRSGSSQRRSNGSDDRAAASSPVASVSERKPAAADGGDAQAFAVRALRSMSAAFGDDVRASADALRRSSFHVSGDANPDDSDGEYVDVDSTGGGNDPPEAVATASNSTRTGTGSGAGSGVHAGTHHTHTAPAAAADAGGSGADGSTVHSPTSTKRRSADMARLSAVSVDPAAVPYTGVSAEAATVANASIAARGGLPNPATATAALAQPTRSPARSPEPASPSPSAAATHRASGNGSSVLHRPSADMGAEEADEAFDIEARVRELMKAEGEEDELVATVLAVSREKGFELASKVQLDGDAPVGAGQEGADAGSGDPAAAEREELFDLLNKCGF